MVVPELYPIPVLTTITSVNFLFSITGLSIAPEPSPVDITFISGIELYSLPWFAIRTLSILPLTIIGFTDASLPEVIFTSGKFTWFNIFDP